VRTARRLVTSLTTSRDYDVVLVTSQSAKSSHSETRTWLTIRMDHLSAQSISALWALW